MTDSRSWGGTWTETKINTLRDYLQSFQTALKFTQFHRSYIDALAGDGTWQKRDTSLGPLWGLQEAERAAANSIREGSALAAISIEPPFHKYIFNDLDHDKATVLKQRATERGIDSESIEIKSTDANVFVQDFCQLMDTKRQRGVIFLDPWGMQVNWSTIERIAGTRCLDMWYLFPTRGVVRMLTRSGLPSQAWCDKLDSCLGRDDWRTEFYRTVHGEDDLFGQAENRIQREASFESVQAYVVRCLKETFEGTVLEQPLRLGPRNNPLFSFCFASANPSEKAKGLTDRLARGVVSANRSA